VLAEGDARKRGLRPPPDVAGGDDPSPSQDAADGHEILERVRGASLLDPQPASAEADECAEQWPLVGLVAAALALAGATAALAGSSIAAAGSYPQSPKATTVAPVSVSVFSPQAGDEAGSQSKGFFVDLAVRYPSLAASGAGSS
jgi:hypothetical protein